MTRIVIAGGPRTGKTTLADMLAKRSGIVALHTDDLIEFGWSEASAHVAEQWLTKPGPWIVEGVAAARALRKFLRATPNDRPCDEVIVCNHARVETTPGQQRMAKGCAKVFAEIEPALRQLGVRITPW